MTNPNVNPNQPEFIDNRAGNTMDAALLARIEHLARTLAQPPDVDIVTGYFNAEGFIKVAAALEKARHVRLLLGAEPVPPPARSLRDERALRKIFRPDAAEGEQTSRELSRFVKERGFQPWRPPEPLPPIEADDDGLVVWMGVEVG